MTAVRFEPDPLLSRSMPRGKGAFDVLPLLVPARPTFRADASVLTASSVGDPLDGAASLPPPDGSEGTGRMESDHGSETGPSASDAAPESSAAALGVAGSWAAGEGPSTAGLSAQQVQEMLALRYREGFEDGLAQGAQLAAPDGTVGSEGLGLAAPAGDIDGGAPDETALLLQSVGRALLDLNGPQASAERFEPLKRLALHLATELVRAELSLSSRAVDRLVRRCVEALDARGLQVVVELHPLDLQQWRSLVDAGGVADAALQSVQFKEDSSLARGSVRARSDHACVEDLIEHRLAGLIQDLRVDAARWQADQDALSTAVQALPDGLTDQEAAPDA